MTSSSSGQPHVGVVGAGIQGVTIALELADRGCSVTLLERDHRPLSRASRWNEGKLHLGLVYGKDETRRTVEAMTDAALCFEPFMLRYLDRARFEAMRSAPFIYAVHRETMVDLDAIRVHFAECRRIFAERAADRGRHYPGLGRTLPIEPLGDQLLGSIFNPDEVIAAFETGECAVNPQAMADALGDVVAGHPRIDLAVNRYVETATEEDSGVRLSIRDTETGDRTTQSFASVVNAAWDDRLRLDQTYGVLTKRRWVHRYKYGIRGRWRNPPQSPSVTMMLGPFGDVVRYAGGDIYLSWYPACMTGLSDAVSTGWDSTPPAADHAGAIIAQTFDAVGAIMPGVKGMQETALDLEIGGGSIFAWGSNDIDDPRSRLHRRHDTGVETHGRYHSVNTGKYTTAPLHALTLADRICGHPARSVFR